MIWLALLALLGLTVFATLNQSLHSVTRARLADEWGKSRPQAALDALWTHRSHDILITGLARSAANLVFTVSLLLELHAFPPAAGPTRFLTSCCLALLLILVFGAAVPHAAAKYAGAALIAAMSPLLGGLRLLCFPVVMVFDVLDPLVRRLADVPEPDAQAVAEELEKEILNAVSEGEMHGAVDSEEKQMIESVIEMGDTRVEEIMTPRTDVVAVPSDADFATVIEIIRTRGHSRIPVFDETIDTVIGVLYAKDLFFRDSAAPFDLTRLMRKALFVPESKLVRDLLREFRERKVHMAIVLDEYGGTAGLATIEDILEELVGEIADEYDTTGPIVLQRIDADTVEVDARMRIEDLNEQLSLDLPEDADFETIGGLVFSTMGKIPRVGESCEHADIGIQVVGAEPQRITRVRLRLPQRRDQAQVSA